jgi:hypothetical protein
MTTPTTIFQIPVLTVDDPQSQNAYSALLTSALEALFKSTALRQFPTQAAMIAATDADAGNIAQVATIPGAYFVRSGTTWLMQGIPAFANVGARDAAITAPIAGYRVKLLDRGYEQIHTGAVWVGAGGLVRIKPTSVTGGTINADGVVDVPAGTLVTLNGIFNSDFDAYKIVFKHFGSAANLQLNGRLAAGGTANNAAGFYFYAGMSSVGIGAPAGWGVGSAGASLFDLGRTNVDTGRKTHVELEVFDPQVARNTTVRWSSLGDTGAGTGVHAVQASGMFNAADIFDGFQFIMTSGTIGGRIYVYGYGQG